MVPLKFQFLLLLIAYVHFKYGAPRKLYLSQDIIQPYRGEKYLVSIFYESNGQDSKDYIVENANAGYFMFKEYLKLKFIPFGKSRSINNGSEEFECPHGPAECLGNMVQDCALDQLKTEEDEEKKMEYVICEMKSEAGSQGRFDCVEQFGLSSEQVKQCVKSGQGTALQLKSENLTSFVKTESFPAISFNGKFDQEFNDYARVDLRLALCDKIKSHPSLDGACGTIISGLD